MSDEQAESVRLALAAGDGERALQALVNSTHPTALVESWLPHWIVRGAHFELCDFSRALAEKNLISVPRQHLNSAWSALAAGDLQQTRMLLPERVSDLGQRDWSMAAEAALIHSIVRYHTGDLVGARTFAGLAQSGLSGPHRLFLLRPALLMQATVAMHLCDVDSAEASWQQAAGLPVTDVGVVSWTRAIEAIAHYATGAYDNAVESADTSITTAAREQIAGHLFPQAMWSLLASIHRDCSRLSLAHSALQHGMRAVRTFPNLPVTAELSALNAQIALDMGNAQPAEAIAGLMSLGTHPFAVPEFQDLIDMREAYLRIRINDLTRARVLIDRMAPSPSRTYLEASADAEARPSKTLVQTAGGGFRWHRQQVEVEMIRARARFREPRSSAIHLWRALELAALSGAIRPLIDIPMAARHFSKPDLGHLIRGLVEQSSPQTLMHYQRVLDIHGEHALVGPQSHALTARELEILRAVADGGDFASVARLLVLSRWTVRGHFYSACKKLGVSGREAAVVRLQQIDTPRS